MSGGAGVGPSACSGQVVRDHDSPEDPAKCWCGCADAFECMDLRIVNPSYQFHLARVARNTAKGLQHIMFRSRIYGGLEEALEDCEYRVALTRWADGGTHPKACITFSFDWSDYH
jgi:hypothetical protein